MFYLYFYYIYFLYCFTNVVNTSEQRLTLDFSVYIKFIISSIIIITIYTNK